MDKVNLRQKLGLFQDCWSPRVVGELNGQQLKLVRTEGEFVWHSHEREDECFLVLEGTLEIHLRERVVTLGPGELLVVPRGVEHRPVSRGRAAVLLFEPATTRNTGALDEARTREPDELERI